MDSLSACSPLFGLGAPCGHRRNNIASNARSPNIRMVPESGSRQATIACSWRGRPVFRARTPGAPPRSTSGRVSANRPRRRPLSGRSMTRAGTLEAPLDPHPLRFTHGPLHPHMETRSAHLQVPSLQWFSGPNNFRSRDRWRTVLLTLGCTCKRPAAAEEQGDEQIVQRQQVWFEEIPGQGKIANANRGETRGSNG
jgi:hypothetical protein